MIKDLPELIEANVISQETAERISDYYHQKKNKEPNRLIAVFGIIGAILVGMGIILIVAHNWDDFGRTTKSILAFLPLLLGQASCAYALIKKKEQKVWLEASSAFMFFSVGACIAMISQIYHISGSLPDFILTWMLLTLPQIYILNSSVASLFYLIGITYYAGEVGYSYYHSKEILWYWLLIIGIIPHYLKLLKNNAQANWAVLHSRMIPISLIIALGTCGYDNEELLFISFISLFSAFFLFGYLPIFRKTGKSTQSYSSLGLLGIIVTLIPLTFDWIWDNLFRKLPPINELVMTPEFISIFITTCIALYLLLRHDHIPASNRLSIIKYSFLVFIAIFLSASISPKLAELLSNLMLLLIGIRIIRQGIEEDHLGILNYGLLVLTTAILCKFFDTNISFIIRGLVFVGLGIGFFYANYMIIQKRKRNEQ